MHMMSLADIPMIVLFGPTNSKKFAPKSDQVKIIDSKKKELEILKSKFLDLKNLIYEYKDNKEKEIQTQGAVFGNTP